MTTDQKLIAAAVSWWESQRPLGWDQADHFEDPTVNTSPTFWDSELAIAVAEYVKNTFTATNHTTQPTRMNTNEQSADAPTPESHRAYLASIDDTGCVTRMEPIWDTMHRLERERDEARAEAARLRELIGLASTSFSMLEAYLGPQWFEAVSNMELVGPDKIHSAALAKEGQR